MPLQLVTAPTAEPLSLTEAKLHLRVSHTSEDTLITALIAAARGYAEAKTQRQIMAARWKLVLDGFPGCGVGAVPPGRTFSQPENAILIACAPVQAVESITYLDSDGVRQTLAAADYAVDLSSEPCRITPAYGATWPSTLSQIGAVEVTFVAGHAVKLTPAAAADTISVPSWKTLAANDGPFRLTNRDGALPAGLVAATDYYVKSVAGTDLYTLSTTAGGSLVDITGSGTGEHFLGEIPAGLKAWMLCAIGALYENRETVQDERFKPLAFIDGLLDPYRVLVY